MKINLKIKNLRKKLNLTQDEFAEKIGVNKKTIVFWENEKNEPTKSNLLQICNICNLPSNYFEQNVTIEEQNYNSEIIKIPYWSELPEELKNPDFSCVTAEKNVIVHHWYLDPKNLCIVPMVGDKMAHYWYPIADKDILIVNTEQNYIMGNGVYFATSRNNTRLWIREMQALINDDVQIKSFAPSGEIVKVFTPQQLKEVDFKIIGKVIKNVSFRL